MIHLSFIKHFLVLIYLLLYIVTCLQSSLKDISLQFNHNHLNCANNLTELSQQQDQHLILQERQFTYLLPARLTGYSTLNE